MQIDLTHYEIGKLVLAALQKEGIDPQFLQLARSIRVLDTPLLHQILVFKTSDKAPAIPCCVCTEPASHIVCEICERKEQPTSFYPVLPESFCQHHDWEEKYPYKGKVP